MKQKKSNTGGIIIIVCIIAVAIILLIFGMQGKTTTTGQYPDNVNNQTLSCSGENLAYPFFEKDNSLKNITEINIIFSGNSIRNISLSYTSYYDNKIDIVRSEAVKHAALNGSFAENGLEADSYNANYAKLSDRARVSIFVDNNNFDIKAAKYFMIDVNGSLPDSQDGYRRILESQNFICKYN